MKITVNSGSKKTHTIKISNWLIANRIFASYIYRKLKKEDKKVEKKQIIKGLRLIKKYSKEYKDCTLVEIVTKDNVFVDIKI